MTCLVRSPAVTVWTQSHAVIYALGSVRREMRWMGQRPIHCIEAARRHDGDHAGGDGPSCRPATAAGRAGGRAARPLRRSAQRLASSPVRALPPGPQSRSHHIVISTAEPGLKSALGTSERNCTDSCGRAWVRPSTYHTRRISGGQAHWRRSRFLVTADVSQYYMDRTVTSQPRCSIATDHSQGHQVPR